MKQEIGADKLARIDDNNGEIYPYYEIITNKGEKVDTIISQMEQWLILGNVVNFVRYNRHSKNFMN